jgi:cation transport protein ChaC
VSPRDEPDTVHEALWIFAYGSLMWRQGFPSVEAVPAVVHGWRRAFCIYSTHHRGNDRRPGLVLALDRGGACHGMAFRVAPELAVETLAYLRAREQINGVYREAHVTARLEDGSHREIRAIAYVAERAHPSYTGSLPLARQVRLIRATRGKSGTNVEYLVNTLQELHRLGVRERELERIMTLVGPYFAREQWARHAAPALIACCRGHAVWERIMRPAARRRFIHRRQMAEWALAKRN